MAHRFSFKPYRLPLRIPLRTAHGLWAEREGLLLRVERASGRVGYGEVAPIPWFGTGTLAEMEAICRRLNGELCDGQLTEIPPHCGSLRFALAAALDESEAGPGAARLPLAALLPAGRDALAVLAARVDAGFLAFKWKVGVERPEEELGLLDDLLARLPGYAKLRLDANGAWDRRAAGRWLERCAERPVEFVEQPLPPADEDGLLGLARDYPVPLALDESVVQLESARRWHAQGWPGIFVLKPALAGTLDETAVWIRETKADVVLSSAIETALGRAQIVRWALRENVTVRALGLGVGEVFADQAWNGPLAGPVLDAAWCGGVNPEALWNGLP